MLEISLNQISLLKGKRGDKCEQPLEVGKAPKYTSTFQPVFKEAPTCLLTEWCGAAQALEQTAPGEMQKQAKAVHGQHRLSASFHALRVKLSSVSITSTAKPLQRVVQLATQAHVKQLLVQACPTVIKQLELQVQNLSTPHSTFYVGCYLPYGLTYHTPLLSRSGSAMANSTL